MDFLIMEENTLRQLQLFSAIEEMNEAVKQHKAQYTLNKTDRAILDTISRYACKYIGVCYLSKQKIAKDAGFTSRRTAIRACHRLEKLGVIKQYITKRKTGDKRQSTNIIVIQCEKKGAQAIRSKVHLPSNPRAIETANEGPSIKSPQTGTAYRRPKEASYKTYIKANTYKETYQETELGFKRALKYSIPEKIFHAFSHFFNSEDLYKIYGVLLRAKAKINPPFMIEDYEERYIDYFYNAIRLYKKGKVHNLPGYLYVMWERLTAEISRQINSSISGGFSLY